MLEEMQLKSWGTVTLGAVLALVGSAISAAAESPSSTYRDTATVTVIEVPVVVLEGRTPVRGLSADDFLVLQDGVEQTMASFEQVDLSLTTMGSRQQGEQTVSLAGRRYFLLAFDLAHMQPHNARRAVVAARELLQDGLHPTDLVGVSVYSAVAGARLLYPFTSDHSQVEAALLAVEAVTSRDRDVVAQARATLDGDDGGAAGNLMRFLEEIRVFTTQQAIGLESTIGPAGDWLDSVDSSTGGGALMVEILLEMEAEYQKSIKNVVRDRSFDLLETLAELATALGGVRGQRYFVLFSEGIDESIFENPFDTHGSNRLAEVLESFRRSGWVVQAIDASRDGSQPRGMYLLANETGGREYRNFNALDEAMGLMLEQTSISYVLSFQPQDLELDGSYHRIDVRLRNPRGRQVRHRDGFFAPESVEGMPDDILVAKGDQIASYMEGGTFKVAAMAAPFKHSGATALVPAIVEIDGPEILMGQEGDLLELQVDTYLLNDSTGAILLSTRNLTIDLATHGDLVRKGGIKVLDDLLLGPGEHLLRVVVLERGRGRRSVVTLPVVVPDFGLGEPQLLQPFFPEVSPKWLVVTQGEKNSETATRFPFEFAGRRFLPQAEVILASDVAVPICVMAFDLPTDEPQFQLVLVGADGARPVGGNLQIASELERAADGIFRVMARLETAGLAAGEYQIQVIYTGDADNPSTINTRAFEIRRSGG